MFNYISQRREVCKIKFILEGNLAKINVENMDLIISHNSGLHFKCRLHLKRRVEGINDFLHFYN